MDRQSEIQAKRAKIAELRRLREEKLAQKQSNDGVDHKPVQDRESIDQLVDSLVGPSKKPSSPITTSSTRPSTATSSRDVASPDLSETGASWSNQVLISPVFDIPPKQSSATPVETYSKEVQTDEVYDHDDDEYSESTAEESEKALKQRLEAELRQELESQYKTEAQQRQVSSGQPKVRIIEDDDDEDDEAIKLEGLEKFLNQSSKVIGRAIDDDYDILVDYAQGSVKETQHDSSKDRLITEYCQFTSSYSAGRAITGLDWSTKHPELVASSHTEKNSDPHAPKGLIQIWNTHHKSRPEYVFNAQSDILNVKFSPFEPNIIFGTAYNGQVLSWDTRSGPHPVLRSPLTGGGHTHPVYSLQISGTQNANNLITSSSDGTICTWTSDLLAKPQDRLVLSNPSIARNDEVSPTCLSTLPRDPARFVVGTEEGTVYQCNRFDEAGARAGLDSTGCYKGHLAPITALDFHDSRGAVYLGDYFLTCSFDWSVRLWRARQFTAPAISSPVKSGSSSGAFSDTINPLLTFNRSDMVYDVSWSPAAPGVFANVDGTGHVELWDLSRDMEIPISRIKPSTNSDAYLNRPLNKIAWRRPDGSRLAVGGLDGVVTVFDVSIPPPTKDTWTRLKRTLGQLED
ncbi:hypothetical protein TRICI_001391 [Trichomonascus ciferrii]|uniref:Uncharacterized protein n=1 Tax=Trichomonascus ciferrii TaxID=44093 RepID=A0A642V9L9_9ASCO|nr:hypothetical protein TRICI_001391 [Trichomonascus ciferrii]